MLIRNFVVCNSFHSKLYIHDSGRDKKVFKTVQKGKSLIANTQAAEGITSLCVRYVRVYIVFVLVCLCVLHAHRVWR